MNGWQGDFYMIEKLLVMMSFSKDSNINLDDEPDKYVKFSNYIP